VAYIRCAFAIPRANEPPQGIECRKKCDFCGIDQWKGVIHCEVCKECIEGYDHHCGIVMVCIGKKNQRYFIQMICYAGMALLYQSIVCTVSLMTIDLNRFGVAGDKSLSILGLILSGLLGLICICMGATQVGYLLSGKRVAYSHDNLGDEEANVARGSETDCTFICGKNVIYWLLPL